MQERESDSATRNSCRWVVSQHQRIAGNAPHALHARNVSVEMRLHVGNGATFLARGGYSASAATSSVCSATELFWSG